MHVPSVRDLQKVSPDEYHKFMIALSENWVKATMLNNIQTYCDKLAIPSDPMINVFFKKPEPQPECKICKGRIKSTNKRCWRVPKPGSDYCGYHKGQQQTSRRRPPPQRSKPNAEAIPQHYTTTSTERMNIPV